MTIKDGTLAGFTQAVIEPRVNEWESRPWIKALADDAHDDSAAGAAEAVSYAIKPP